MSRPLLWALVALLGAAGALARFLLDNAVSARAAGAFPLGTMAVNASGALLLGLLSGVALSGDALVLAGSALLGSYTTFSTWMLETQRLTEDAEVRHAAVNVLGSVVAGIAAAAIGRAIGASL